MTGPSIKSPATVHCAASAPNDFSAWSGTTSAIEVALSACFLVLSGGSLRASKRVFAGRGGRLRRAATASAAAPPSEAMEEGDFNVSMQYGVCAPYGEPGVSYWDPAGLAKDIDSSTFRFYRKAELKHGRVCMLAVTGLIVQHEWRFNLAYPYETPVYDFSSVPSGIGAMMPGMPTSPLLGLFVLAAGLIELRTSDDGRDPGDFGDPAGFAAAYGLDFAGADDKKQWQDFELNHCRLAMVGFLGAILGEYASGLDAVDQWWRAGAAFRRTFAIVFPQGDVPALESFF